MRRPTITISKEDKIRLDNMKVSGAEQVSYVDTISYLLDSLELMQDTANGKQKAALQLMKWLRFGHDVAITSHELRKWTGVRLNSCKDAIEIKGEEVEVFNKQFK